MSKALKRELEGFFGNDVRLLDGTFECALYSMDSGLILFSRRLFNITSDPAIQLKNIGSLKKLSESPTKSA